METEFLKSLDDLFAVLEFNYFERIKATIDMELMLLTQSNGEISILSRKIDFSCKNTSPEAQKCRREAVKYANFLKTLESNAKERYEKVVQTGQKDSKSPSICLNYINEANEYLTCPDCFAISTVQQPLYTVCSGEHVTCCQEKCNICKTDYVPKGVDWFGTVIRKKTFFENILLDLEKNPDISLVNRTRAKIKEVNVISTLSGNFLIRVENTFASHNAENDR